MRPVAPIFISALLVSSCIGQVDRGEAEREPDASAEVSDDDTHEVDDGLSQPVDTAVEDTTDDVDAEQDPPCPDPLRPDLDATDDCASDTPDGGDRHDVDVAIDPGGDPGFDGSDDPEDHRDTDPDADAVADTDPASDDVEDALDDPDTFGDISLPDATHDLPGDAGPETHAEYCERLHGRWSPGSLPGVIPPPHPITDLGPLPDASICTLAPSVVPTPAPIEHRFYDWTHESGFSGIQWTSGERIDDDPCGEAGILSGGVAIEDFDGDGFLDVFVPRMGFPDQLYRNDGTGNFVDVAAELGVDWVGTSNAAAWVDVNADGRLDLWVGQLAEDPNRLYIQQPCGGFVDEAAERGLAMADLRTRECGHMFGGTFADADGDGDLDFLQSRWIPSGGIWGSKYFENDGTGHFTDRTQDVGLELIARSVMFLSTFADFDGDGDVDVLITGDFGNSKYLVRRGEEFVEATCAAGLGTDENGMGTSVVDINGDGHLDIFITSISGETDAECRQSWGCSGNRMYINDGHGRFADCTDAFDVRVGGWGWGATFFDADNSGRVDLAMTSGYTIPWPDPLLAAELDRLRATIANYRDGGMRLWMNDGRLPFQERSVELGVVNARRGRALVAFDADNDGDLDLFVINNEAEPVFFLNTGAEGRAWLRVRLRDEAPNTFGIGARIDMRLRPGSPWVRRDIVAGGSFLATAPHEAHYGLGDHHEAIDRLRVTWPDGRVTTLESVEPNQVLIVSP